MGVFLWFILEVRQCLLELGGRYLLLNKFKRSVKIVEHTYVPPLPGSTVLPLQNSTVERERQRERDLQQVK